MGVLLDHHHHASDTRLLEEFASWLRATGQPETDATVADADVFTFWRRVHSSGALDAFDEDDIVDFLLEWCPRNMLPTPTNCARPSAPSSSFSETPDAWRAAANARKR